MGQDQSPAQTHGGRHHQGVDGELATASDGRQQIAGDPGDPHPGGHHPGVPPTQLGVDRLVPPAASVQLDQHRGGHPHRLAPTLRHPGGRPHPLVTTKVVPRPGQSREGLAVEDQGHAASYCSISPGSTAPNSASRSSR